MILKTYEVWCTNKVLVLLKYTGLFKDEQFSFQREILRSIQQDNIKIDSRIDFKLKKTS